MTARTTPPGRSDPCPGTAACVRVRLANQGATAAVLALSLVPDRGTRATLARERLTVPPGARREAEIDVAGAAGGLAAGRLVVRAQDGAPLLVHPFAAATEPPAPPPLGTPRLERTGGRVRGVRFTLGAFERGDPLGAGTRVALCERLALTLVDAGSGRVVRRLTPPGGARELLPAEYEYTLPAGDAARPGRRALRVPRGRPRRRAAARRRRRARRRSRREDRDALRRARAATCATTRAASLERVRAAHPFSLVEVDIETDDALFKRYLERIPVVALDGDELFELFVDEEALVRKL